MRFFLIDPSTRLAMTVDVADATAAMHKVGLKPGQIDHGTITTGIGIIVGEGGIFEPVATQKYFSIKHRLYAGPAVVFAYNGAGETIDFDFHGMVLHVNFHRTAAEVERLIQKGTLERPILAIEGEVFWQWPDPKPDLAAWAERVASKVVAGGTVVIDGDTIIRMEK